MRTRKQKWAFQWASHAASGVWDKRSGQLVTDQLARWKLTKGQVKQASGINDARSTTQRWLALIQLHFQHLAAASSAGTSLVANLKHITVHSPQAPCSSQAATQPAASEPGPSIPLPAKHSEGKAAKAKPAPQPGRWVDRDCNAALNMQRIGESRWRTLELCYWPEQGKLPAKGKEYPELGYKRLRDKPPKAQQQQQPAVAQ
ncbi:hypothetical protein QJQ45_028307 [Haematococcus lacustris]|nr:hypothetical protein QJQ45_028307 [Haematococcus lacustris]